MNYDEMMKKYLNEKKERREIEDEEMKKRWIEKWGEESWNETEKTVEKMADRIMKWQDKSKKNNK
jgi:Ethanolamine utilization protein EutJ (predicted chaperonin)